VTVRDAHLARFPGEQTLSERERIAAVDELAESWRRMVRETIDYETALLERS
jgi:hypothetical protein